MSEGCSGALWWARKAKQRSLIKSYTEAGFDPDKDLLQAYYLMRGDMTWDVALPRIV